MLQQALQKIQSELADKPTQAYVQHVGGFLINHIRKQPEHAAFILVDGKTIVGSLAFMKEEARKSQSNGVGVFSDEEGFAIVLKYFGVPVRQNAAAAVEPELTVSSIDDLL